jgi:hypothetical protein
MVFGSSMVFDELCRRPEVTGSSSKVSGSSTVFDEQSHRSEVYGSSSTVIGSLSVSSTSFIDDDNRSIRSIDDGSIGSNFSDHRSIGFVDDDDGSIGSVGAYSVGSCDVGACLVDWVY